MTATNMRNEAGTGSRLFVAVATMAAVVCVAVTIIWFATGGPFWPMWVWNGLALPLALALAVRRAWSEPRGAHRRLALQRDVSIVIGADLIVIWLMSGGGFFWPVFALLGLGLAHTAHVLFASPRQGELAARVDELTRTRRGVIDVQAEQLRQIERDLHDGAQSRLVALSLKLGRAEARLEDRPEEAELLRQAREEATAAVVELRDLARGIAPPVLSDRGLVAAVQALADRSGARVEVEANLPMRPPPVVENAAYFVTAESLTNAVKHAPGAPVRIVLGEDGRCLVVRVSDEGPGGANPMGSGLTGLRQRVEALDGRLAVDSIPGSGTTIVAVLPCG
jgi:signal transduction histidine kinase